jgi:c-di-GMP-binding flagellar brake protein YcgR
MATKPSTRRAHNRVTAFLPVTIATDRGVVLRGEIEDISTGGASIRCVHEFSQGEKITVDLHFAGLKTAIGSMVEIDEIDDEGLIRATEIAEVRWQKGSAQIGVRFTNLKLETKKFLSRLVKFFERIKKEDLAG